MRFTVLYIDPEAVPNSNPGPLPQQKNQKAPTGYAALVLVDYVLPGKENTHTTPIYNCKPSNSGISELK